MALWLQEGQRVKVHKVENKGNYSQMEYLYKAKNLLKKIQKISWGQEKAKLIIEDPSGNSAIISEKAVKSKLK